MRVISQNGNVDLPYEHIVVCHATENVIALHNEKEYVLGKYSSQEKSYKAMEMLRESYESRMELDGGYDSLHKCYVQPNYWVLPKTFQFPQDDEIEV